MIWNGMDARFEFRQQGRMEVAVYVYRSLRMICAKKSKV
jgi:hypothetical protein